MPECAASIFSKIYAWKIGINDVETFVRTNKKKKLMTYTYHEYNIVPTIDVILLASGFFCLAKPKSAVKKKI